MQLSLLVRQKITLVLISLLSLYSGAYVLIKNIEAIGKQKIFSISEYEKSLAQIKKDITNYESVGYVADKPIDTSSGEYATAMYYLTQYAVAPTEQ